MSRTLLWVMTVSTGLCVANLYYNQPLLHQMQQSFGADVAHIGLVPTLTQLGYALGMLLLIPLGDLFERKRMILISTLFAALTTLLVAYSPNLMLLWMGSLLLGITTMTPQLTIPFAAHLAPSEQRGKTVGTLMSGLLIGILLARTVSGFIGAALGWRAMFLIASVVLIIVVLVLAALLPKSQPTYQGSYWGLMKSLLDLVRTQPLLRESAVIGACLFGAFSTFWATLIFLMETPYFGYGSRAVGLFGLLGASGAIAAPWVGRIADRRNPRFTIGGGIFVAGASFILLLLSAKSLVGLMIGVVLMDLGVQAGHISNQSRVLGLIPEARSRLNTIYMFSYFIGGALGSSIGAYAWSRAGWVGVCLSALGMIGIAAITFLVAEKSPGRALAA